MTKTEITALLREYQSKDARRKDLAEEVARLDQQQKAILDQLTAAGVSSDNYGPYRLAVISKPVARVTDWPAFHAYLIQSGNLDMLTKHITQSAIMARLDDEEYVPAIAVDEKIVYKVTAK